MMKYLPAGLAVAVFVVCGGVSAAELTWLSRTMLERHLTGRNRAEVPVGGLLPQGHVLCAVGSYTANLPAGYEKAEKDLQDAYLLPVREGDGLVFSVNEARRVQSVSELSVWPDTVTLSVNEPLCIPATSAYLDLGWNGNSIVIRLKMKK